jgi:hypothetical protein
MLSSSAHPSLLFLAAALRLCGCAQDQDPSLQQLDQGSIKVESPTPQLKLAVTRHVEHRISPLVYISWFPRLDSEEFAEVDSTGSGFRGWVRAGPVKGPILFARATPTGLSEIHALLDELPPSAQNVPQHQAVIFTWQTEAGFHTRIYERFALPASIHRIWHLIASPGLIMDCTPPATTQSSLLRSG